MYRMIPPRQRHPAVTSLCYASQGATPPPLPRMHTSILLPPVAGTFTAFWPTTRRTSRQKVGVQQVNPRSNLPEGCCSSAQSSAVSVPPLVLGPTDTCAVVVPADCCVRRTIIPTVGAATQTISPKLNMQDPGPHPQLDHTYIADRTNDCVGPLWCDSHS